MSRIERSNEKYKRPIKSNYDPCAACGGSGDCLACDGTGSDGGRVGAKGCDVCAGSAVCIQCNGSGVLSSDDE